MSDGSTLEGNCLSDSSAERLSVQVSECKEELGRLGSLADAFRFEIVKLAQNLGERQAACSRLESSIVNVKGNIRHLREAQIEAQSGGGDRDRLIHELRLEIGQRNENRKVTAASEQNNRNRIKILDVGNQRLQEKINNGSGWTSEQQVDREEVLSKIEIARYQLSAAKTAVATTESQIVVVEKSIREGEHDRDNVMNQIDEIDLQIDRLREVNATEQRRKGVIKDEHQQLESELQEMRGDMSVKVQSLAHENECLAAARHAIISTKNKMDSLKNESSSSTKEEENLSKDLEHQVQLNRVLDNQNVEKQRLLEHKQCEMQSITKDISKARKQREIIQSLKLVDVERERESLDIECDDLRAAIDKLESADIALARKESESQKRQIDALERKSAILQRKTDLSEKESSLIYDLIKVNENTIKNLRNELNGIKCMVREQKKAINHLKQEQSKHDAETESAIKKLREAMELLKEQADIASELQRKASAANSRLKQRQSLYESIQNDCNMHSKALIEKQEEIELVKRHFHVMCRQIHQLKDEISKANSSVITEHFHHHHTINEKEALKCDITHLRSRITASEHAIAENEKQIKKLCNVIEQAEKERDKLEDDYGKIMSERDVLGSQLVSRNMDLEKLNEKLKTQQSALHHGDLRYHEHRARATSISSHIKSLIQTKDDLENQSNQNDELIRKAAALEKGLIRERGKNNALAEELMRPINIHRWRQLEHRDPKKYELLQRYQKLQRRILETADAITEKDRHIQEKEAIYIKLQGIIDQQPRISDMKEQLYLYQSNYHEKEQQMKRIAFDLEVQKRKVTELQGDLSILEHSRRELKSSWIKCMLTLQKSPK